MSSPDETVETLRAAAQADDASVLEGLLADEVLWSGEGPGGGCRTRDDVLAYVRAQTALGVRPHLDAVRAVVGDRVLLEVGLASAAAPDVRRTTLWLVLTLDPAGRITEVQHTLGAEAAERDMRLRAAGPVAAPAVAATAVGGLTPFVYVADVRRSVAFYALLGLEVRGTHEPEGVLEWALVATDDARLMLARIEEPIDHRAQRVFFYLYAPDLAALRDALVARGLSPGPIVDGSPGPAHEMRVTDPDGYDLMIAQTDP